jgi:hypothetical protein
MTGQNFWTSTPIAPDSLGTACPLSGRNSLIVLFRFLRRLSLWRSVARQEGWALGPSGHPPAAQVVHACSGGLVTEQIFDCRFRFPGRTNWPTLRLGQFCQSHKPWERGRCVNGKPRRLSGRRSHLTS